MIRIEGVDGYTPTARLMAAITELAPQLTIGGSRKHADITIRPRCTVISGRDDSATRDAWYDLYWSHPAVVPGRDYVTEQAYAEITHEMLGHITTLPPPDRIPLQDRIAAAEPITLDGWSEADIALYDGEAGVREMLTRRRDTHLEHGQSVDAYDWTALAQQLVDIVDGLEPPPLTPGQRAQAGAARLIEAVEQLHAARASVTALLRNAETAGETTTAATVRAALPAIDHHFAQGASA
jgi:hypothetical protein